jgi:GNAT superfamily N-acetyltransferase
MSGRTDLLYPQAKPASRPGTLDTEHRGQRLLSKRNEYILDLHAWTASQGGDSTCPEPTDPVSPEDAEELGELLLAAYRGSVDDEGETLEEAVAVVEGFFKGAYGPPLLDTSRCLRDQGGILSACLVSHWEKRQAPLICFIMSHPAHKGKGLGRTVLEAALRFLATGGYLQVHAFITEGNIPSEALFLSRGFRVVETP